MTKEELTDFLSAQITAVDGPEFDLPVWQNRISLALEAVFGASNRFSRQVQALKYDLVMSYESLYPEKVKDVPKSHDHFKATLTNVVEQIGRAGDSEFARKGSASLKKIKEALDNRLTGNQLKNLKASASSSDKLMEIMRTWDPNLSRKILADILTSQEIWND